MIRPIDPMLTEVIIEVATSHKIRLNVAKGKEMLNDIDFYRMDPEDLGSDTEPEAGEEDLEERAKEEDAAK